MIHYRIFSLNTAFPDNVHVSHFISQTVLKVGGYRINEFIHFGSLMLRPHHIRCWPSGSIPVDGSSSSTTGGLPRMLSAKHSCNQRNSASGTHLRGARSKPGPRPTFLLTPSDKAFAGRCCWSCSASAASNLQGTAGRSGFLPARRAGGSTRAARGRDGERGSETGFWKQTPGRPKPGVVPSPPKMVFPFNRI